MVILVVLLWNSELLDILSAMNLTGMYMLRNFCPIYPILFMQWNGPRFLKDIYFRNYKFICNKVQLFGILLIIFLLKNLLVNTVLP